MDTYRVNDMILNVHECAHCGKVAGEGEAQAAVRRYLELMGSVSCCVCGKEIIVIGFEIMHGVLEPDGACWLASPTDGTSPVTIRIARRAVSIAGSFHESCARTAMPYLSEDFWKENARKSIWPTISGADDRR